MVAYTTSPCSYPMKKEFTRRDWSKGLRVPRTVHMKRFVELISGTCSKNSNQFEFARLVAGTKFGSLQLTFEVKMVSSHNDICPRDLLQGLVPSCVPQTLPRPKSPARK